MTASTHAPAVRHVRAGLDLRLRALIDHDPGTRDGVDAEDLHQARVSVRRMRAVLKAALPALDRRWADELRDELGWLGRALGPVRDLDVLLDRLRGEAVNFPADERAAVERLVSGLVDERESDRETLLEVMSSARYHQLLHSVATAVADGLPGDGMSEGAEWDSPVTVLEAGGQPLDGTDLDLIALIDKQYRRLVKAVKKAGRQPPDDVLHDLSIHGKRVRYTAELAEPSLGRPVRRLLKATTAFQDVLGDHQDACIAQERIRNLLDAIGEDLDVVFVAGRLVEREQARREDCRARWWDAWLALRGRADKLLKR
jgi:CHAD domain-containing protein